MSAHINDTSAGRCTAALVVKGESFRCDLAAEHGGWVHSNQPAEAIWNGGEPPVTAADRPTVTDNARAETTTGAIARGEALAAGDPNWMNVTRWPQPETTTATTEDALDSLPYFTFEDEDVYPDEEFVRKADVARLLATARTRPTREQVTAAIGDAANSMQVGFGVVSITAAVDAVLALYADQPTEAEAGARALEDAADEFEAIEQRYAIVHSPVAWLRERADRTRDGAR